MNQLFELFRGGLIFEVSTPRQAEIAERAGAVALLLDMNKAPIHPDGSTEVLDAIFDRVKIPVLTSFRPGHFVEAEVLKNLGVWGVYADSRYHQVFSVDNHDYSNFLKEHVPMLADVESLENLEDKKTFVPVLRADHSIEDLFERLQTKIPDQFVFVSGPIETVADIALLKRMGADVIMVPNTIFDFPDANIYLHKLVEASFYYDNTSKLAALLESEKEEVKISFLDKIKLFFANISNSIKKAGKWWWQKANEDWDSKH